MSDLPDFYMRVVQESVEAGSFVGGADAAKSASPVSKDIYLATDTGILYVCFADGVWTNIGVLYLLLAGGTMSGAIAMGGNKITGLAAPTADADAARKVDVDTVEDKLDDFSISEVTGSRAIDTDYTNTSGKVLHVYIDVMCQVTTSDGSTLDGWSKARLKVKPSGGSYVYVGRVGLRCEDVSCAGAGDYMYIEGQVSFEVPPNYIYQLETSKAGDGEDPVLNHWVEVERF